MKSLQSLRPCCFSHNNFSTDELRWLMSVVSWMWWDASDSHNALCVHSPLPHPTFLPVSLCTGLPVYLSLAERRSVVIGSCWMVWCSIRASRPARLVMAILRFLSCSNSSSSLYHWQTDRQTGYSLDCRRRRHPGAVDKVLLPHHSDSLQVDLGAAQLLPAVVLIALPLGDAAELTRGLKDVFHQRAAAHLVSGDLSRGGGRNTQRAFWEIFHTAGFFLFPQRLLPEGGEWRSAQRQCGHVVTCSGTADQPLGLWNVPDTEPAAACSRFYSEGCRRRRRGGSPCETDRQTGSRVSVWGQEEGQAGTQPDRQTSRQTAVGLRADRQADRHTAKQADRLTAVRQRTDG